MKRILRILDSNAMCEFESNILKLLKDERERLKPVVPDKNLPYMKSLEHGIQSAEKKLEECTYKMCLEKVYRQNVEIVPAMSLHEWSKLRLKHNECKKGE